MAAAVVALGVVAVAVALFAIERIPVEVSSLALVVLLVTAGLLTPQEALAGFSSDAVIFIFALLAMTQGLEATGVMRLVSERVLAVARLGRGVFTVALLAVVCAFSTVASNTAVTAAFLPIVAEAARRTGIPLRRLLLPVAFSSMLGGTIFLFGTSTNLVVSAAMERLGLRPIGFAELAPVGIVLAVVGIGATVVLAGRLLPELSERQGLDLDLVQREYVTEIVVGAGSPLVGKPLGEIDRAVDVPVLGVVRKGAALAADPRQVLAAEDRLIVGGSSRAVLRAEAARPAVEGTRAERSAESLPIPSLVVEAWIPPTSALVGRSVDAARFADVQGLTLLGVHRHPALRGLHRAGRLGPPGSARYGALSVGDVLLLRGPEERVRALVDGNDVTLLGEIEHRPLRYGRAGLAAAIFAVAVAAAGLRLTSPAIAGLCGLLAMIATGCVDSRTAFRVDWRVVILIGSLLALGAAMEKSGAGELVARNIIPLAAFAGPRGVLCAVMLLTIALSIPMSNQASALVMVPIAFHAAVDLGLDPRPFVMGTCLAASCAFMTPLEPSAALVYGPGHYRFADFLRVGAPITAVMLVLLTVAVPVAWPFR
jgi:di/tricarboxylate transporter